MLTYFRINYLTNLTYFPIFPHYVDFFKVAAASPLAEAAAAAAAQLAAEPQSQIVLRCSLFFFSKFVFFLSKNLTFLKKVTKFCSKPQKGQIFSTKKETKKK